MPESTASKQSEVNGPGDHLTPGIRKGRGKRKGAVFVPQTMGIFVLLIIILSFIAGAVRGEMVLTLTGAVFFAVWVYCMAMTLLLALVHCRRFRRVSIRLSPRETEAGGQVEAIYTEEGRAVIVRLPGILVRCRLLLSTKDGRRIRHVLNPRQKLRSKISEKAIPLVETFTAAGRGAYFSDNDEFVIFDALGFFRFVFRIPVEGGARLLVSPHAAGDALVSNARAGESNSRPELTLRRTDNFIDHRPYVPGDDPRRINWKLYGHGGELFVREGEREPPPHSHLLILTDTQFDPLLYSPEAARRGVDLLCENALAAALASRDSGMDVITGFTRERGGVSPGGDSQKELAAALAWPAALPLSGGAEGPDAASLPAPPPDRGVLIFALPRTSAGASALENFLREAANRNAGRNDRTIEVVFLYGGDGGKRDTAAFAGRAAAAETCATLYGRRSGVRARAIGV